MENSVKCVCCTSNSTEEQLHALHELRTKPLKMLSGFQNRLGMMTSARHKCTHCDLVTRKTEVLVRHLTGVLGVSYTPYTYRCPCGVLFSEPPKAMNHIVSAHLHGEVDLNGLQEWYDGPQGHSANPALAARDFMIRQPLTEKNLKVFEGINPSRRVRLFRKEPRPNNRLEVEIEVQGISKVFLLNKVEANGTILSNIHKSIALGARFVGTGHVDIDLLGFRVGGVDATQDFEEMASKGFLLVAAFLFLRALWKADRETRGYLLSFVAMSMLSDTRLRKTFMGHARQIIAHFFEAKGHAVDTNIIVPIMAVLSILLFKTAPSQSLLDSVSKAAAKSGHFFLGGMRTIDGITRFVEWLTDQGCETIFGVKLEKEAITETKKACQESFDKVLDLLRREESERMSVQYVREVKETYYQVNALQSRFVGKMMPANFQNTMNNMALKMNNLYMRVRTSGVSGMGGRIEPLVIGFNGKSGCGKSHIAMHFTVKILRFLGRTSTTDWPRDVFVRDASNKFWDNYHEQPVVLYDDFGQLADSTANPNPEFLELIKSQNIMDWPVTMAALEDKANTYFKSRAIVLTTNMETITTKSLTCNEALARRVEYNFKVVHKKTGEGYKVNKSVSPNDYDYFLSRNGQPISGEAWSANDILKMIKTELKVKEERYQSISHSLGELDDSTEFPEEKSDTEVFAPEHAAPIASGVVDGVKLADFFLNGSDFTGQSIPILKGNVLNTTEGELDNLLTKLEQGTAPQGQSLWDWLPLRRDKEPLVSKETRHSIISWLGFLLRVGIIAKIVVSIASAVWTRWGEDPPDEEVLTHEHEGLEVGKKISHKHKCESCQHIFTHKHTIRHPADSWKYSPHLCDVCGSKWKATLEMTRVEPTGIGFRERRDEATGRRSLAKSAERILPVLTEENNTVTQVSPKGTPSSEPYFVVPRRDLTYKDKQYSSDVRKTPRVSVEAQPGDTHTYSNDVRKTPRVTVHSTKENRDESQQSVVIPTGEMLNDFDVESYVLEVARRMHDGDSDFATRHYWDLNAQNRERVDAILTRAHVERTDLHRRLVFDAWSKNRVHFPSLTRETVLSHDESKYSLLEMIGYTVKWHDEDGKIAQWFRDKGYDPELLWESALAHHYRVNAHHPQNGKMDGMDLEEAICDMVAVSAEKRNIAIPQFEEYQAMVREKDDAYLARFESDDKAYILAILNRANVGEMVVDTNARQLTVNVQDNQYMLFVSDDEVTWNRVVNVFFLSGRIAFMNRHAGPPVLQSKFLRIENHKGKRYTMAVKEVKLNFFKTARTDDVCIAVFPKQVAPHKDLRKHLVQSHQLGSTTRTLASLLTLDLRVAGEETKVSVVRNVAQATLETSKRYKTTFENEIAEWDCATCYTYRAETAPGDCGSVLVATNPKVPNKILGFHVWGFVSAYSGALVVTKEDLDKMLDTLGAEGQLMVSSPIINSDFSGEIVEDLHYQELGFVQAPPRAMKTKLRRTPFRYKQPEMAPAMLRKRGDIDPVDKAIRKYSKNLPSLDPDILQQCVEDYEKVLNTGKAREHYREYSQLSIEQAIRGVPEMEHLDSINRTTSPGYPFVLQRRAQRGKQHWINDDFEPDDELRESVSQRVETLRRGERAQTLWVDSLKDEKRPLEKVAAGKTRMFCAGPMDYTVVFRMFFLAFCGFATYNRISNEMAIGIDPYTEWDVLASHLSRKGKVCVAGDFSGFDGTLHPAILHACLGIINRWADDGNDLVREMLWEDIVHSCHVIDGETYQVAHGNPSGNPMTSILNSMYNSIASRCAYVLTTGKHASSFTEDVAMISYGDDNVYNVRLGSGVTQQSMTEGFEKLGMKYTMEDKSSDSIEGRTLEQVTFLKRGFERTNFLPGYIAPLDLTTVLEIPLWNKTELDEEGSNYDNIESCFRELALHGEEVYEHWTRLIINEARTFMDVLPIQVTWARRFEMVTHRKPGMGLQEITVIDEQQSLNPGRYIADGGQIWPIGQCLPSKIKDIDPVSGREGLMQPRGGSTRCIAMNEQDHQQFVTNQEIVQFKADDVVQESTAVTTQVQKHTYKDLIEHDVKAFLGRPYEVLKQDWASSDGMDHNIVYLNVDSKLKAVPAIKSKLDGFTYMRADMKVRVMCNFTAFQAGKLLVAAYPRQRPKDVLSSDCECTTFQLSTFRHVEIDAGTQEEVEISLPFCHFKDAVRCDVEDSLPWYLVITVLNPLTGASNNEVVDVNVYAWYENIELGLPTGHSMDLPTGHATEAEKKQEEGVISGALSAVASAAHSLTGTPLLSEVAGPVAWVADAAKGVASFFGFSKPTSVAVVDKTIIQPGAHMGNTDGIDTSHKMSLLSEASIKQLDEVDDMSLAYVCSRQGIIDRKTWDYANGVGNILWQREVSPRLFNLYTFKPTAVFTKGVAVNQGPPMTWASQFFQVWHGSVSYRFSFAKNSFYTGKLLVTFTPAVNKAQNSDKQYRKVISLKESSEFVVTIPYVSDKPWTRVKDYTGCLTLEVFNRLQATSTVASQIQFNVWAWSDDMKFAIPEPDIKRNFMALHATPQLREQTRTIEETEKRDAAATQKPDDLPEGHAYFPTEKGESDLLFETKATADEDETIGEKITNLRTLARRFVYRKPFTMTAFDLSFLGSEWELVTDSGPLVILPLYQALSCAYVFMRGSMRVKAYSNDYTGTLVAAQQSLGSNTRIVQSGANFVNLKTVNGCMEVEIPFYSATRRKWADAFAANAEHTSPMNVVAVGKYNSKGALTDDGGNIFLAGGDDFTYSHFFGAPLIWKHWM